jgi:hypothetical protein
MTTDQQNIDKALAEKATNYAEQIHAATNDLTCDVARGDRIVLREIAKEADAEVERLREENERLAKALGIAKIGLNFYAAEASWEPQQIMVSDGTEEGHAEQVPCEADDVGPNAARGCLAAVGAALNARKG